jgi:hypothetical protein
LTEEAQFRIFCYFAGIHYFISYLLKNAILGNFEVFIRNPNLVHHGTTENLEHPPTTIDILLREGRWSASFRRTGSGVVLNNGAFDARQEEAVDRLDSYLPFQQTHRCNRRVDIIFSKVVLMLCCFVLNAASFAIV